MLGAIFKRWNLVNLFVVPFFASLMRVSWVRPLLLILLSSPLMGEARVEIPFWLLVSFAFAGALTSYLDVASSAGRQIVLAVGLALLLIGLYVVFPPQNVGLFSWLFGLFRQMIYWGDALPGPLILVIAGALLWWRGMATPNMGHDALVRAFLTGTAVLVLLLLLNQLIGDLLPARDLVVALLTFIVSALLTLALVGASDAIQQGGTEAGISLPVSRYWLLAVMVVIAAILVGAWLISALIAPDTLRQLIALTWPLWALLGKLLYYILLPFIYILFRLLEPLLRLFEGLSREQEPEPVVTPQPEEQLEEIERVVREMPPQLDAILRIVLAVAIIAFVVWLIMLALRRRQSVRRAEVLESRESVFSWDLLKDQVRSLFRRARPAPTPPFFIPLGNGDDPRLVIRAAYQRLLALAIEQGLPRLRAQTPNAYYDQLSERWPEQRDALRLITENYIIARYRPDPPTMAQAEATAQAVAHIQNVLTATSTSN